MIVVVNHLTLAKPLDAPLIAAVEKEFIPLMRRQPGFVSFQLARNSDTEAVVIVGYRDQEAMREIGKNVASPWFIAHVRPYLAEEGQRTVGELICSAQAGGKL
jgi:quinol monooxygenase YgiN